MRELEHDHRRCRPVEIGASKIWQLATRAQTVVAMGQPAGLTHDEEIDAIHFAHDATEVEVCLLTEES